MPDLDNDAFNAEPEHPNPHVDHFAQRNPEYAAHLEKLAEKNHARVAAERDIDAARERLRAAGILN
ncbi:hypothetical protein [Rhodococcus ruber]